MKTLKKITFFDVETPNRLNDRICAIGIIHVVDGIVEFEGSFLIHPEAEFDDFNTRLHGIGEREVRDQFAFNGIWPNIEKYFTEAVVVAHNATFDLGVLSKTLKYYNIEAPDMQYVCTVQKARRNVKSARYSLDYLSNAYGIKMERHHEAMSDAQACKSIFDILVGQYGLDVKDVHYYRMGGQKQIVKSLVAGNDDEGLIKFNLEGKICCLTGDFSYGTKEDIEKIILDRGGQCHNTVINSVSYVIVGNEGSERWSYGNYGQKVKKALEMKEKGKQIEVLRENEFLMRCGINYQK